MMQILIVIVSASPRNINFIFATLIPHEECWCKHVGVTCFLQRKYDKYHVVLGNLTEHFSMIYRTSEFSYTY